MTRLEIIESFDEETKAKFIKNCNGLNRFMNYDWWLNKDIGDYLSDGIGGAFGWDSTPEGYDFWEDIDKQILNK